MVASNEACPAVTETKIKKITKKSSLNPDGVTMAAVPGPKRKKAAALAESLKSINLSETAKASTTETPAPVDPYAFQDEPVLGPNPSTKLEHVKVMIHSQKSILTLVIN